jgi:hypothetical protein
MIEHQSSMRDKSSVAFQPVRLLPGLQRAEHFRPSAQFRFDTNTCADERLDAQLCSKAAGLVKVEVISAKEASYVHDSGHPAAAGWRDDEVPRSMDQAVFWTQSAAWNRSEWLAGAGKQLVVGRASAKEPCV